MRFRLFFFKRKGIHAIIIYMKKVICPKCGKIFDIDEEHDLVDGENVVCPDCKTLVNLYQTTMKIEQQYRLSSSNAYRDLYKLRNYKGALENYEICLKLKDNDLSAIAGMIMSQIYGSNVDEPNFKIAIEYLEKYDILLNPENSFIYLNLVRDLIYACDQFLVMCKQNLCVNDVFISKEYFDMYLNGINEINELDKYFESSIPLLDEEEYKSFREENKNFDENNRVMKEGIEKRFNKTYDVNGVGEITLKDGKIVSTTEKKYEIIVPEVVEMLLYPINKKLTKLKAYMIGVAVVLSALIVVFIVSYFVTKNVTFLYLVAIPVVLSIIGYFSFMHFYKKSIN